MHNFYLHARRAFKLDEPPEDALVFVTASNLYQLFVNGALIGRGPNPADPSRYYYDTYDVSAHLRAGANVVAALCSSYAPKPQGVLRQNWGRGGLETISEPGSTAAGCEARWLRCRRKTSSA